jgi:hypothetical protein
MQLLLRHTIITGPAEKAIWPCIPEGCHHATISTASSTLFRLNCITQLYYIPFSAAGPLQSVASCIKTVLHHSKLPHHLHSPSNVLHELTFVLQVRLADWGISVPLSEAGARMSTGGTVQRMPGSIGTEFWCAPEVERVSGGKSDTKTRRSEGGGEGEWADWARLGGRWAGHPAAAGVRLYLAHSRGGEGESFFCMRGV